MSMSLVATAVSNPILKSKQVIEAKNEGALTSAASIPGDISGLISWASVPTETKTNITTAVRSLLANLVDDAPNAVTANNEHYRFLADTKLVVNAYGDKPAGETSILEIMNIIAEASGSDKAIEIKPTGEDVVSVPLDVLNIASESIVVVPSGTGSGRSIADLIREEVANKVAGDSEVSGMAVPSGLNPEQIDILSGIQDGGGIGVVGEDAKSAALCLRLDNQLQ